MKHFLRKNELSRLTAFAASKQSEFIYVRGRRRIGKSWLLEEFRNTTPNCFMFSGAADSSSSNALKTFAAKWAEFSSTNTLTNLKTSVLTWPRIFSEMSSFANNSSKHLILIFDEIQWLPTEQAGFIGALKEAWVKWQIANSVSVIVCGSSNKFFQEKTGGEEKILRGLQTMPALWVKPLRLPQVHTHCLTNWNIHEASLLHMMIGGIPYYLQRLNPEKGFIHAINDAFFTKDQNLLEEVDELLNLEFNKTGRATVKRILAVLGQEGSDQKNISLKTGISKSTVSKTIEKLVDYNIVFRKTPAHIPIKGQNAGTRYYMKDFFLNFYFQILAPNKHKILTNSTGLIFPSDTHLSQRGYYIPNFSGHAFELLVRQTLEHPEDLNLRLFKKLLLKDTNYDVLDYWVQNETQVDLIVEHKQDRISRVIECKWGVPDISWLTQLINKGYEPPAHFSKLYVMIVSSTPTNHFMREAEKYNVTIITLSDLF